MPSPSDFGSEPSRFEDKNASARDHALGDHAPEEEERDEERSALALMESERDGRHAPAHRGRGSERDERSNLELSDDASIRDFYAQLVGLLTQESQPRASVKKSRAGLKEALRRRWLPALAVFLATLFGLCLVLRPGQANYTSTVVLLLPPRDPSAGQDPFVSPEELYDPQAQIGIIGSQDIVSAAMKRLSPELRQRGFGDRNAELAPVDVSSAGSESLVQVAVSSNDPVASLALSQAMVSAYDNYTRTRSQRSRDETLRATRQSVAAAQRQLAQTRALQRALKERYGIIDLSSAQSTSSASIAGLQSALDAERRAALSATTSDATLLSLQQTLAQKRQAYDSLTRIYFSDAPNVVAARQELSDAQASVNERRAELASQSRRRITELQASLGRARSQASVLPAVEQRLSGLNAQLGAQEAAYRTASDRLNQLQLLRLNVPPTAKLLYPPTVKSSSTMQKVRALAVALVGSLLLGLLTALLLDRVDKSVRTAPDPDALWGAPLLGALPAATANRALFLKPAQAGKGDLRGRTQTIEACANAQANILAAAERANVKSILFTSAIPGEGKSECASNLAAAMAYSGREVLLLDADFWNPTQHENFDLEPRPGYAQVLRENMPMSQAIRPTSIANLYLLTTGQTASLTGDIVPLLQGRAHRQNMELLKRYFDVIVIDAPPTLSVADAQLLSSLADGVVLISKEGTHRDEVQRARSMLRLAGGYILGVVVNAVRPGEVSGWNPFFSNEEPFEQYSRSLQVRRGH